MFVLKDWCSEAANFPGNDDWHTAAQDLGMLSAFFSGSDNSSFSDECWNYVIVFLHVTALTKLWKWVGEVDWGETNGNGLGRFFLASQGEI